MDAIKLTEILKKSLIYESDGFLYYSRYQNCKTEMWCADIIICPIIKYTSHFDLFLLNNYCLNQVKWRREKTIRQLLVTLGFGNNNIFQTFVLDVNQNYYDGYEFGEDLICLIDKSSQNASNLLRLLTELHNLY